MTLKEDRPAKMITLSGREYGVFDEARFSASERVKPQCKGEIKKG
jgi:hypothetical protein